MQTTVFDDGQRVISLETSAKSDDQRIRTPEARLVALANKNNKLVKTSDLKSWSCRNNIRIIGLSESIEGPASAMFFLEAVSWTTQGGDLQSNRAHRMLAAKPWPVIIRLHRSQIKDLIIWEALKKRGKLQYQGAPVQIFEDYAQEVAKERAKYHTVMADLYNLSLRPALLFLACLQVTLSGGTKKTFSSPEEPTAFTSSYKQSPRPD